MKGKRGGRERAQERRKEGRGEMSFIVCRHLALSLPSLSFLGRTESFRLARGEERERAGGKDDTAGNLQSEVDWTGWSA